MKERWNGRNKEIVGTVEITETEEHFLAVMTSVFWTFDVYQYF